MERQTNFSKRIFSIILSLLMVLSMMLYFPGSVFNELSASADSLVRASFNGFEITASTSGYLEALNKTINDSSSNLTNFIVTLENDITMENSMVIPEGKNVIINLDGHKLSYGEGPAFSVSGNLTINGSGTITSGNKDSLCSGAWIYDGGTLNVNNASFVSCIGTIVFNIKQGGTVNMNSGSSIGAHVCPKDSVLPLLQGTVVNSGTFNMNDSAELAQPTYSSPVIEIVECCGLYNTSGGIFNANGGVIESKVKNEGTITRTVTDSTTQFNDEVSNLESGIVEAGNYNGYFMNNGTVKGGNFTNAISGLYRVTFYKDGGILETQYRAKAPITVPTEPTKAGYKFTGWYNNGTKWDTSADVTSDMILNAGWEDTEAPIISGIVNNGKYCLSASFTVSDNVGVASVTSNGNAVPSAGGKYTLSPASGVQSVVVKDKAGNTTTYSVTVNEKHTYNNSGSCSVCSLKDTTAPVISGIENNKTYCLSAKFTVSDNHQVDSVTINGKTVFAFDGKYTISPASGVQSVVVKDKAGNTTTYKVTVNANHSFNDSGICTNCNVADKEKPVLSGVVNKGVYCLSAEFTVSDNHKVDSVEINGEPAEAVNGKYKLSPATGKQSIIITDIAGNTAIYYVTVNAQHSDGEGGMCSVCGKDNTAPVFSGIADGESYCESSQFSVSDNVGVVSVTLNGKEITPDSNGNYIISSSGEHKIIAKDTEGNTVSCTITIQNHLYSANGFCTACDVYEPADKNSKGEYKIGNAGQLYWFADKVNNDNANYGSENAVLTADIVVNTGDVANCNGVKGDAWIDWTPIGNSNYKYTGTFDGQNHTISGLYFNYSSVDNVGLFGYIGYTRNESNTILGGKVSNVHVADSYFNGCNNVGGVCGYNRYGTITNCSYKGTISGSDNVGGVCGYIDYETIKDSYNEGTVSGGHNVGGVCGYIEHGTIKDSYNAGKVSGSSLVGGVCGKSHGKITNCQNTNEVSADSHTGGVCGINYSTIEDSQNTGKVSASSSEEGYAGGVCGKNESSGTIKNSNSTGDVSGCRYVGGVCGDNSGTIENCYNTGSVSITISNAGGVCGYNSGEIKNSYNTGSISATVVKSNDFRRFGGVCGYNSGTTANCYNTGVLSVSGPADSQFSVSGVCGENNKTITNCYYLSGCNAEGTVLNTNEGIAKTSEKFKSGEVAYLLQGEQTEAVWGQTINTDDYPVLGGKKVLANVDESQFANDIIIYGQNASLDGTIGFNIYVSADDSYEWDKTVGGVTGVKNEDGLYVFTYNLAAKDMDENINFAVNDEINVTVSVSDYLADLSKTDNESLKNLADSMSNYGDAAKSFFSGETVAEQTVTDDLSIYDFTTGTMPEGIIYYGSSLILESETTIRHYFKLAEGKSISEYTISVDNITLTPVEKQGYYYIDIKNISAEQLGTSFIVSINGEEVITNYSVLSYVNKVLESDSIDDNLKNLVKALYIYNQNALAYTA